MSGITAKVREYGNSMAVSTEISDGESVTEMASKMFESQVKEIREILDICADADIIEDFHFVEGPPSDILRRWRNLGWFGKFASPNYDKMEAHFHCRKKHQPEIITLDYINEIIKQYALQQSYLDDDEDEDYQ